jgi:hypothetical protein
MSTDLTLCDIKAYSKSCDLGYTGSDEELNKEVKTELADKLLYTNGEEVPKERIAQMQEYAKKLKKKHPQFSDKRLQRKVADYFKIKLL